MKKSQFNIISGRLIRILLIIILLVGTLFSVVTLWFLSDEKSKVRNAEPVHHNTASVQPMNNKPFDKVVEREIKSGQNIQQRFDCIGKILNDVDSEQLEKFKKWESIEESFQYNEAFSSQLAYALVSSINRDSLTDERSAKPAKNQLALLEAFSRKHQGNSLVDYFLVSKCVEKEVLGHCDESIVSNAVVNDPNNGALWFQIAMLEASKNNIEEVISALEQVVAAPNFNMYWSESVDIFDDALESAGVDDYIQRMNAAVKFAGKLITKSKSTADLSKFCLEQSEGRADIAQLCLGLGDKLVVNAKFVIEKRSGYGLQKAVYRVLNDERSIEMLEEQEKEVRQASKPVNNAFQLLSIDAELERYWFEQLKFFGGIEAIKKLNEEVNRLTENPDYNPCLK
ncbi:hypothetical protein [Aliikangiella coralliicola]|uniref:Uncharacterized protein n=1 Tax=Aliikangiella coralliicola TaxID=2592383 RepID=A0A545UIZ5_9GAMM|nr:hypothetical protein [Aliikangiella coralliicola]TQV89403.1 hypothetical protein FLL46_00540 [Aliikangiella coralliicola]